MANLSATKREALGVVSGGVETHDFSIDDYVTGAEKLSIQLEWTAGASIGAATLTVYASNSDDGFGDNQVAQITLPDTATGSEIINVGGVVNRLFRVALDPDVGTLDAVLTIRAVG